MNTKSKPKDKSWVIPGTKFTHKMFIDGIRKAETGPFYTFEELQELRKKWRQSKKSQ